MTSAGAVETEEDTTCLYVTVYHPNQEENKVFRDLRFNQSQKLNAHQQVMFGRNCDICDFNLVDNRVSRVQFSLQFFRHFDRTEFGFEIKNLSKRTSLMVEDIELGYLNKADLPESCIVCFGDYQILMEKHGGKSEDYFEIRIELAKAPLLQERHLSSRLPVPEQGLSYTKYPIETDENE